MTEQVIHDASIGQILTAIAEKNGVDSVLCQAVAWTESGLNPEAVGDNGTSFGLFQLHEGGELGSLTRAEAFSPITNAATAIPHIAAVAKEKPTLTPGEIAADAQGPADSSNYALVINALYDNLKRGIYPNDFELRLNAKTGLAITIDVPEIDPTMPPPIAAAPKSEISVTLPIVSEGLGMPPSQPHTAVKAVQTLLSIHGLSVGNAGIDGKFGPATAEAVAVFQSRNGIPISQSADAATWEKLIGG